MSNGKPGFITSCLSPGQLLLITGTMRSGKSNIAVYIMEMAVKYNYHIYTNTNFFDYDEIDEAIKEGILKQLKEFYEQKHQNIHIVTTASELIKGLYLTKKNITILDEAQFFAGSARGNAKIVRWFKEFVTQIGKLRSSIILLTQVKSELSVMLKKKLPSYEIKIFKLSWNNRYCEIWYNPPQTGENAEDPIRIDMWGKLPASKYPYDHEAPAMFEFDIDMEQFLVKISKLNSIKIRREIPRILDEMLDAKKKVKTQKKKSLRSLVVVALQKNPLLEYDEAKKQFKNLNRSYFHQIRGDVGLC